MPSERNKNRLPHWTSVSQQRTAIANISMALLAMILVVVGALGGFLLASQSVAHTVTSISTETTTVVSEENDTVTTTLGKTSETNTTTQSCYLLAPSIGVVIRVITNSTSPVAGARVSGESAGYCNNSLQVAALVPTTTNSSGWASLLDGGFGIYHLNISWNHAANYTLSIPTYADAATYVIFNYVSGNVTTTLCYYNSSCLTR